jgi:predicted aldo/keto reductase-like oxidoreductase
MSAMQQVQDNVASADASRVGALTADELDLFDRVREQYQQLVPIGCTGCRYCMPCPEGVDIPANLGIYNEGIMYDKPDAARGQYDWFRVAFEIVGTSDHDTRAIRCVQCGACEEKCPQKIPISRWMPTIHQVLGEGQPFVMTV